MQRRWLWAAVAAAAVVLAGTPVLAQTNKAPTEKDWLALSKRPDLSGVWTPSIRDQIAQIASNPTPWTPAAQAFADHLREESRAGRPYGILVGCMPPGMPSMMLMSHTAMEIVLSPGRVMVLGESDGNRLRRIYTDGRPHPEDPDLTFHGHSIGHWEGDTLVVDTVGIAPESWLALDEDLGVPSNGDMHIVERIHLAGPDELHDDLEITAPHVLTRPWKTTRRYLRQRSQKYDLVEGECVQGDYVSGKDAYGNSVLLPLPRNADGSVAPLTPAAGQ